MLEKIIRRIILPKYPWIKDFDVRVIKEYPKGAQNFYSVYYYPETDEDGGFTVTDEFEHVESDTKNLYSVLGPTEYDWFSGVSFRSYENKIV